MSDPVEVLDFWLGEIGPEGWFAGTEEIDAACEQGFAPLWEALRGGGLEHWLDGVVGSLAYIVVADQFSRNIHRGKAEAFATDPQALAGARRALEQGWDLGAPEPDRQFFYLPFEHSEDPADQDLAVRLMQERVPSQPDLALHARAHREMIRRFGRFPLRNAALGRVNTPQEEAFLAAGGYGALVAALRQEEAGGAEAAP